MTLVYLRSDFIPLVHTTHEVSSMHMQLKKFSVDTLESIIKTRVVSARLLHPFIVKACLRQLGITAGHPFILAH